MYEQIKKNTVKSENQLNKNKYIKYINPDGKGIRVLFLGNSITLHGIKTEIGWENEWGMAASKKENDYVHLMVEKIKEIHTDAVFSICQVAEWEGNYKAPQSVDILFEESKNFGADIIIARFIENCPVKDFDGELFEKAYFSFVKSFDTTKKAQIILTTGFWRHPGDDIIRKNAQKNGCAVVELGDLGEIDEMKAIGLFWHKGVAEHPGDKGMKAIAERIFKKIRQF